MAPLANDPIMSGTSIRSFRHLKHQNPSTGDDFIHSSGIIFLVALLATMEAVAPLVNDPIMLGRSIQSFRHLEHQNPSSNSRDNLLVSFLAMAPLVNDPIMLGRSIWLFR